MRATRVMHWMRRALAAAAALSCAACGLGGQGFVDGQRLLPAQPGVDQAQAERLARPDPRREFALVAAEPLPPGEALVGAVARIAIDDNLGGESLAALLGGFVDTAAFWKAFVEGTPEGDGGTLLPPSFAMRA